MTAEEKLKAIEEFAKTICEYPEDLYIEARKDNFRKKMSEMGIKEIETKSSIFVAFEINGVKFHFNAETTKIVSPTFGATFGSLKDLIKFIKTITK